MCPEPGAAAGLDPARPLVLVTCEHAGRDVPAEHRLLFRGARSALASHRGWDAGALAVALRFAARLAAPVVFSTTTRLLVDIDEDTTSPELFSEYSRGLPNHQRTAILEAYYHPHRRCVQQLIADAVSAGRRVLHVGVHSLSDGSDPSSRERDLHMRFDPEHPLEPSLCERWRASLCRRAGDLRYALNQPERPAGAGLTAAMRSVFPAEAYAGINLELRQGLILHADEQRAAGDLLARTLPDLLEPVAAAGPAAKDGGLTPAALRRSPARTPPPETSEAPGDAP